MTVHNEDIHKVVQAFQSNLTSGLSEAQVQEKSRQAAKWIIGIVLICALIIPGLRHIVSITGIVFRLIDLVKPILIGILVALILNVPMSMIEQRLLPKLKIQKGKRSLSIILALILIIGIFVGVALLVIPELVNAFPG